MIGESIRKHLEDCIAKTRYGEEARSRHLVFFARKGFSDALRRAAEIDSGIQLIDLEELVRTPEPHPAPSPP